ncbi:MAG: hypothetical protein HY042_04260 [Spirochaetia bacterium]|nr:hypothetical protein [Spirochaetia bacterium]
MTCNRKPDAALCGSYYTHLIQLHQGGHKGVLAALKTTEGKRAVVTYCMTLTKSQVDCASKSPSVEGAASCEAEQSKSWF